EAGVLAYAARTTMTSVIATVLGPEDVGRFAAPILYGFLFVLVAGSFACLQSFVNAIRGREVKFLIQMIVIQLFVMFFEAMFFARGAGRAVGPRLRERHGIALGLTRRLLLAAFGWMGVRAAPWFLFAQYGTPPLLAFIAREPVAAPEYGTPDRKGLLTRW